MTLFRDDFADPEHLLDALMWVECGEDQPDAVCFQRDGTPSPSDPMSERWIAILGTAMVEIVIVEGELDSMAVHLVVGEWVRPCRGLADCRCNLPDHLSRDGPVFRVCPFRYLADDHIEIASTDVLIPIEDGGMHLDDVQAWLGRLHAEPSRASEAIGRLLSFPWRLMNGEVNPTIWEGLPHWLPAEGGWGTSLRSPDARIADDAAVDRFAASMKAKMAAAREKGRGGWDDPERCTDEFLADLLVGHLEKRNAGNLQDIANLAMMLDQRGAAPGAVADALRRRISA